MTRRFCLASVSVPTSTYSFSLSLQWNSLELPDRSSSCGHTTFILNILFVNVEEKEKRREDRLKRRLIKKCQKKISRILFFMKNQFVDAAVHLPAKRITNTIDLFIHKDFCRDEWSKNWINFFVLISFVRRRWFVEGLTRPCFLLSFFLFFHIPDEFSCEAWTKE